MFDNNGLRAPVGARAAACCLASGGGVSRGRMRRLMLLALAGTALSSPAAAAPLVLGGDYIKIGVNDVGTLGSGGSVSPGILYDGTGTGTFNTAYDYLTPGSPFEGWTISGNSGSAFNATNNNAGGGVITGTLTDHGGVAYNGTTFDNRAVWTGTLAGVLTVTHDYHFDDDGQQLNITTTITALTDLTGLTFARFTDPDAVAAAGDSSSTNNFQGATGVPTADLVYAEALVSKYVIGLYSADPATHNTAVTSWTTDTASYLAGGSIGDGDNTIGMGFDLGALTNGSFLTFNYAYIFGTDIEAAIAANGGGGQPPAPAPTEIVSGQPFTVAQLTSGAVEPVFAGGVLTIGSSGAASTNFTVKPEGGAIDTAGHEVTLTGSLTGAGVLEKAGGGVLTLTGVNTHGGFNVSGGVLEFESETSLGAEGGILTLSNDAILRPTAPITLARNVQIGAGQKGAVDTGAHDIVLAGDVQGGGTLTKTGIGVLTLSGTNSQTVLNVLQGVVAPESSDALGAAGAQILLHEASTLSINRDMAISQSVSFVGPAATIDTGSANVVLGGAVSGSNCLIKTGAGTLTLNAAGSNAIGACVQQGQLTFNNLFAGQVWVESGGRMSGGGQILGDVEVSGVLAPGNSPGRLVVAGSVTQAAGGTLAIDIDGPTPGVGAGHHDTLVLTGADSVFTAGGAIAPITRGITGDATNTYTPAIGDAFEVVTAEGGVAGAFSSIVQPTDGLPANARFDVIYMPRSVLLAVTPESYAALAGPRNGAAVGAAVDALRSPLGVQGASPAGQFVAGFAGMDAARSAQVLEQAAGAVHAVGFDAALQSHRAARGSIGGRLDTVLADGRRVWAEVGGGERTVDGDRWSGGYDLDDLTVTVGADRRFGDTWLVGVAASYAETEARGPGAARSFSEQAHLYGAWRSGPTYVHGVVSAGRDTYKTARDVAFSTGAQAFWSKTDGTSVSADLEAGRDLRLGAAKLTLAAGLASDRLERDALTETGSAAGALALGDQTREALQGRVGARIASETELGGVTIRPRASLFVLQELGDEAAETDARVLGQSFRARAASAGPTAVRLGASVEARLAERMRVDLGYRYEWSEHSDDHALRARVSFSW